MHNDECIMHSIYAVFMPFLRRFWVFACSEVVRRSFGGGSKNALQCVMHNVECIMKLLDICSKEVRRSMLLIQ